MIMIELVRNESNDSCSCLQSPPSGTEPFLLIKKNIRVTKLTIMHGVLPAFAIDAFVLDNRQMSFRWLGQTHSHSEPWKSFEQKVNVIRNNQQTYYSLDIFASSPAHPAYL